MKIGAVITVLGVCCATASAVLKSFPGLAIGAVATMAGLLTVTSQIGSSAERLLKQQFRRVYGEAMGIPLWQNKYREIHQMFGYSQIGGWLPGRLAQDGDSMMGKSTGFWINPCSAPSKVIIWGQGPGGHWLETEAENAADLTRECNFCFYDDEILRIQMAMLLENTTAAAK